MADKLTKAQKKEIERLESEAESLFKEVDEQIKGSNEDKLNEVLSKLDVILKIDPENHAALSNIGAVKSRLGDHEGAIKDFDQVITLRLNPKDARVWFNRGTSKGILGRYEEAIKDFDQAIKLDSNDVDAWFNRGAANSALNRHEEAVKNFDQAIGLDSKKAVVWFDRGVVNSVLDRYEEAIKDFDEALNLGLDPDVAVKAWFNRGVVNSVLDHDEDAIKDFTEALTFDLDPDVAVKAWFNLGVLKGILGNYEEAIKDFNQVLELDPNDAKARGFRGYAKARSKQFSKAILDFDEAIKQGYDEGSVWNARGVAKGKTGRYVEALADFAIARNRDLGNTEADENYVKMELFINKFLPDVKTHNDDQAPAGWFGKVYAKLPQLSRVKSLPPIRFSPYYAILIGFAFAYICNEMLGFIEMQKPMPVIGAGIYLILWLVPIFSREFGAVFRDAIDLIEELKIGNLLEMKLKNKQKSASRQRQLNVDDLESIKPELKF